MLGKIIDVVLYLTGLAPALMALQTAFRLALIAVIVVVGMMVLGIDPLALAQQMLRDWLIPDSIL